MEQSFTEILQGYSAFRTKYALGDKSIMQSLSYHGQNPQIMVLACCDSRVDPALILQCDPGDLFVARNVANIVPPYENDEMHHGTSAALEFGIRVLKVKHLILFGHSQCGGMQALLQDRQYGNDFITKWVAIVRTPECTMQDIDTCAKLALRQSYQNCLTFPWIKRSVEQQELIIHLWFFDIKAGQIFTYIDQEQGYRPLIVNKNQDASS